MDLPSGLLLTSFPVMGDGLTEKQARDFLAVGIEKKSRTPKKLLAIKDDPANASFAKVAEEFGIEVDSTPASYLENLIRPVKKSFGEQFFSPSSIAYSGLREDISLEEEESAKHMVPDSYDPCPCASGQKFKFCCKPAFKDIMLSQAFAQEKRKSEALKHIQKAKAILGETAEIVCREAIVESFFDPSKSERKLREALKINPNHPRANYIHGLILKERGEYMAALRAYKKAIQNYPKTDRYHLNETYNNLGSTYFEMGEFEDAKQAWEQALILLPSDIVVKRNLLEFIYENPDIPDEVRKMGSFVKRFFTSPGKD